MAAVGNPWRHRDAAQRRSEIAVRLALGALPRQVFRLMVRQGRMLAVVGRPSDSQ